MKRLTSPRAGYSPGQNSVYLVQETAIVFTSGKITPIYTLFTRTFSKITDFEIEPVFNIFRG